MKKVISLFLLAGLLMSYGCFSDSDSPSAVPVLTAAISANLDSPTNVIASDSITVELSAPIDTNTISGEVRLYNMGFIGNQAATAPKLSSASLNSNDIFKSQSPSYVNNGEKICDSAEVACTVSVDLASPKILKIKKASGEFTAGEVYKVVISSKVKSTTGLTFGTNYAGYFTVGSFNRSLIVCVSDIHLGADISYSEFDRNRNGNGTAFVKFLNQIKDSPNVKEFVIAGDLIDEWFIPSNVDTFSGKTTAEAGKTQRDFVLRVAEAHKDVVAALNNIIKEGKIKVTYVPGNHDLLITWADINSIFPGINQARDVKGLGAYTPEDHPEIVFEHGHRYNYFCAPDPISNRDITKTNSILPPGYFFTRIATTSVVEGHPAATYEIPVITEVANPTASQHSLYLYWKSFKDILATLHIREGFNDKIIKTNIDGFTADYAMSDLFPYQLPDGTIDVNLYKNAQDNWNARQTANLVPVNIPLDKAITDAGLASDLDAKAGTQYFNNAASNKRIVVFGHSHVARIDASTNTKSQKTIYANAGTWIDSNPAGSTMSFVVITLPKTGSTNETVGLYKFDNSGNITKLKQDSLDL
ncbi:MAG: metallophosphoesterase [Candidatus Wallbacteria bacterium]